MKVRVKYLNRLLLVMATLLAALVSVSTAARAATTLNVNTASDTDDTAPGNGICSDGSACSLRAAIEEANALAGADTITVPDGTYTLTQSTQLQINSNITINGTGASTVIIQADVSPDTATDRVLEVTSTGSAALNGLTIQNGICTGSCTTQGDGSSGGGIYNAGTLTLNDSVVNANSAPSARGGGIYNSGTLTLNASEVSANSSSGFGGGIYNSGALTLDASVVSSNVSQVARGGGIYNTNTLTVQHGSVIGGANAGNSANTDGGGIYNDGGVLTIDASSVSYNFAQNEGGGIFNSASGTMMIQHGSLVGGAGAGNWAIQYGGGIQNDGTATVIDSVVSFNSTSCKGWFACTDESAFTGVGGGIDNQGTLTIDNSAISANTAYQGAGIANNDVLMVQNGSVIGGPGAGNVATLEAGGLWNTKVATIDASTISDNTTPWGAGVFNQAAYAGDTGNLLTIQNGSAIIDNMAPSGVDTEGQGGGVYNLIGTVIVTDSRIENNGAGNPNILAASRVNNAPGVVINSNLGNQANPPAYGGGIYNVSGAVTVTSSRVLNNSATGSGGGLDNDGAASASVTDSCVANNSNTALVNFNSEEQTATTNWWGNPGGPNTGWGNAITGGWNIAGFKTAGPIDCFGGPFNLTAAVSGPNQVDLAWIDAATDEDGFKVERSPAGAGTWTPLATTAANATSFSDTTGTCDTPYNYRVIATNAGGDSGAATVTATACLILNGAMEIDANSNKIPDNWSKNTNINTKSDKRDCLTVPHGGLCSFILKGNGTSKALSQAKTRSLPSGTPFTFSLWVKTSNVPNAGGYAQAKLTYTDGTTKTVKLMIPMGTLDWTHYTSSFTAGKKVKSIKVTLLYDKASGFIWFDNVSLTTP